MTGAESVVFCGTIGRRAARRTAVGSLRLRAAARRSAREARARCLGGKASAGVAIDVAESHGTRAPPRRGAPPRAATRLCRAVPVASVLPIPAAVRAQSEVVEAPAPPFGVVATMASPPMMI